MVHMLIGGGAQGFVLGFDGFVGRFDCGVGHERKYMPSRARK
jgi:hypothetical protein